jgi:integrase
VSEATSADIQNLGTERGHRTLVVTRKGGKVVTIPLAPRTARAIDLAVGERADGPIFLAADGRRLDPARRRADRPQGGPPGRDRQARRAAHAATRIHHRRPGGSRLAC